MNAKIIAIIIGFATISTQAFARDERSALPTVAVHDGAQVVVVCANERLPTQRMVGAILDSNNAAYVYAERERLAHIAHRECMRGAPNVVFVRDDATEIATLALVDATSAN